MLQKPVTDMEKELVRILKWNIRGNFMILATVFENFKKYVCIYELDPARFLSGPGLAWQGV